MFHSDSASVHALNQLILRECWTLHERIEAVRKHRFIGKSTHESDRLCAWQRAVSPRNSDNFAKRLNWDALTENQATWVLDPPSSEIPQSPEWWPCLCAMREAARDAIASSQDEALEARCSELPFVHVWRPVASWALETLKNNCIELIPHLSLSDSAWLNLAESLLERLCRSTDQPLWELFGRRRTQGQMLIAHMDRFRRADGDISHEAYDAFVAEILSDGYALLLGNYPVLGRLLATITTLWLESSQEMLRRLAEQRTSLEENFAVSTSAQLTRVELGLADHHRGGRAVAILTFSLEDDDTKIVYKPKNLQLDAAYQRFLQVLNQTSSLPPFRILIVVPCGDYGFMEWVDHCLCDNEEQLATFYFNSGRTLAVLHLLGCTDCHFENLIASSENLLLIDTETLLSADLRDVLIDEVDADYDPTSAQHVMQRSVLRSGLLPQWVMAGPGRRLAFDISGLGVQAPPPDRVQSGWIGVNTDGMMPGRKRIPCKLPTSLPVGHGSPPRLSDFGEDICKGFAEQMREALAQCHLLVKQLDSFRSLPCRLIIRHTRLYAAILRQMLEPAALKTAVAQSLKLEQLARGFLVAPTKPVNWALFTSEIRQLQMLDTPYFEHNNDEPHIALPLTDESVAGLIKCSGISSCRERLLGLDHAYIHFQQALIRGAIAARSLKAVSRQSSPPTPAGRVSIDAHSPGLVSLSDESGADRVLAREAYLRESFQIAHDLWGSSIRDTKGRPEWIGMDLEVDGQSFQFGLIGSSFYSGQSGIAILFARLATTAFDSGCEQEMWLRRAWSCCHHLEELACRESSDSLYRYVRDQPLGMSGTGGVLLSLALLQRAGVHEVVHLVTRLIEQLRPERLRSDQTIDIIGGVAGLIGPLLLWDEPRAMELATLCGDHILALQLPNGGWAGASPSQHNPPLAGFSHGASGMAAALARLGQATGQSRFTEGAVRAIGYEQSVFDSGKRNWPDFRASLTPTVFQSTWCHGAPGILLSRLVIRAAGVDCRQLECDLDAARVSTIAALDHVRSRDRYYPADLCCGILGLCGLLRVDAHIHSHVLASQVSAAESLLVRQARLHGSYRFFDLDSGTLVLPGLFNGRAGVALELVEAGSMQCWMPTVFSAGLLPVISE